MFEKSIFVFCLLAIGGLSSLLYERNLNGSPLDLLNILRKLKFNRSYIGLNVTEHISSFGYPAETHTVTTEDGYILNMQRIPHGIKGSNDSLSKKPVVFLLAGLVCSSAAYVDLGPERSIGFLLADLGYDVWLGNYRGTTYSRSHVTLNPDKGSDFWQYSWNEIGLYDLPAMIDYVLNYTNEQKLTYIGHSQATTSYFVLTSEKPHYNEKIKVMIALAPVAYLSHLTNKLKEIAVNEKLIVFTLKLLGIYEILPHDKIIEDEAQLICGGENKELCAELFSSVYDYDPEMIDLNDIPLIATHFPAGASVYQIQHFAQVSNADRFQKFDYGLLKNKKVYGQTKPPLYNLNNVVSPVALFWGPDDTLAIPEDVATLRKELPNVIKYYRVPNDKFGHAEFLWGIKVYDLVYKSVFEVMEEYK